VIGIFEIKTTKPMIIHYLGALIVVIQRAPVFDHEQIILL